MALIPSDFIGHRPFVWPWASFSVCFFRNEDRTDVWLISLAMALLDLDAISD